MTTEQLEIPESPDREKLVQELQQVSTETNEVETKSIPVDIPNEKPSAKIIQNASPFSSTEWKEENETLHLPGGSIEQVRAVIQDGPNVRLDDNQAGRDWADSIRESVETLPVRGIGDRAATRESAEYHQTIETEKYPLAAGVPNLKFNTGDKVGGERAVLRIRSLLGMGSILQVPLWHSGFWITMKAPSEAALLELQRRLIDEKVNLGRNSHGLAFANTSVFISGWLIDFVIAHIYDTTLKGEHDLRKLIRVLDIPTVIWGLACTIWPNGFQYSRACIADPEKCNHVIRERLNLGKILWVDRNSLTERQIAHMMNRGGSSMTLESVQNYLNEFLIGRGRTITVGDNEQIKITFKVPNTEEYINSGYKWVNNIVQMIDSSFTTEPNDAARNVRITELGKATNMRQYSHWIESIDADGIEIDDTESIEQIIDTLSSVDNIRKKYFDEVIKFIDDSTMTIVAVPSFECPACQKQQPVPMERFPHLLPIDVMSSFFTLLVQKLQKIHDR